MRLLLIRHADPDYKLDSLTETGRIEAQLLAGRMAAETVDEWYVSILGRAKATAEPTLKAVHREAKECDWLQEFRPSVVRPDTGGKKKCAWDWLPSDWLSDERFLLEKEWKNNEIFRGAGVGDSYDWVVKEFDNVLKEHGYVREGRFYWAEEPNTKTLAFFCHFGVSCVLLSHLMNVSPMILWHGMAMAPTSVTTVYSEERRKGIASFRATAIGDISHLYANGRKPSFSARFCEVYGNGDRQD